MYPWKHLTNILRINHLRLMFCKHIFDCKGSRFDCNYPIFYLLFFIRYKNNRAIQIILIIPISFSFFFVISFNRTGRNNSGYYAKRRLIKQEKNKISSRAYLLLYIAPRQALCQPAVGLNDCRGRPCACPYIPPGRKKSKVYSLPLFPRLSVFLPFGQAGWHRACPYIPTGRKKSKVYSLPLSPVFPSFCPTVSGLALCLPLHSSRSPKSPKSTVSPCSPVFLSFIINYNFFLKIFGSFKKTPYLCPRYIKQVQSVRTVERALIPSRSGAFLRPFSRPRQHLLCHLRFVSVCQHRRTPY